MVETDCRCVRHLCCDHIAEFSTTETRLNAINDGVDALPRYLHCAIERRARCRLARQYDRERMPARQGEPRRLLKQIRVKRGGVDDARLRQRQRAGLVEDNGVNLSQPLDGVTGIE